MNSSNKKNDGAITGNRKILGLRVSAILEMALFFVLVLGINYFFGDGKRYIEVATHPFWIIILLMAVQYGTKEALVATMLSCALLFIGNLPEGKLLTRYDNLVEVLYRPFLWTAASLIIGELRTRQINERDSLVSNLEQEKRELETISGAYENLKTLKEKLETKLAGEMRSAVSIYGIAKELENLNQDNIFTAAEKIISSVMNPKKFSIFIAEKEGFRGRIFHGWDKDEKLAIGFPVNSSLYKEIMSKKSLLTVINEKDEEILDGEGILAAPLSDLNNGEILGLIKIEELGLRDLTTSTIETFRMLCDWIGRAYANSLKFRNAQKNSITNYDQMLYSYNFFKLQSDFVTNVAKRMNFDVSLITADIVNASLLSDAECNTVATSLAQSVKIALRKTDCIFNEQEAQSQFAILLPGTDEKNARQVVDKIEKELAKRYPYVTEKNKFSFSIRTLNQKKAA